MDYRSGIFNGIRGPGAAAERTGATVARSDLAAAPDWVFAEEIIVSNEYEAKIGGALRINDMPSQPAT